MGTGQTDLSTDIDFPQPNRWRAIWLPVMMLACIAWWDHPTAQRLLHTLLPTPEARSVAMLLVGAMVLTIATRLPDAVIGIFGLIGFALIIPGPPGQWIALERAIPDGPRAYACVWLTLAVAWMASRSVVVLRRVTLRGVGSAALWVACLLGVAAVEIVYLLHTRGRSPMLNVFAIGSIVIGALVMAVSTRLARGWIALYAIVGIVLCFGVELNFGFIPLNIASPRETQVIFASWGAVMLVVTALSISTATLRRRTAG